MKRYRVKLSGKNFLLNLDGDHGKFNFSATRQVRAADADSAKRIALIQIHRDLNLTNIVKETWDVPQVQVESIEELKFFQFMSKKSSSGFEFISEEQAPN